MNTQRLAIKAAVAVFLAVAAFGLFSGARTAVSQEDMTKISAEAFTQHTRPPAVFKHDQHNEKAKIEDCETCHHGKDAQGRLDPTDMSAGTPCAECHAVKNADGTPLMRAYHQQCISCHKERNLGPTNCAGCHKKEK